MAMSGMTKAYALLRLLEHGPLLRHEIVEITRWHKPTLANTLWFLAADGQIHRYRTPGAREWAYRLPTPYFTSPPIH